MKIDYHEDVRFGSYEEIGVEEEPHEGFHDFPKDEVTSEVINVSSCTRVSMHEEELDKTFVNNEENYLIYKGPNGCGIAR